MTSLRKVDPEVLEREYIYDGANPPVSLSQLAERHGLARTTVAEKALKGNWYKRREEFRAQLGIKVLDAMGDEWVRHETAVREKQMAVALKYLDHYEKALDAGEITANTRDLVLVSTWYKGMAMDAVSAQKGEEELIDPDAVSLQPDEYRRALRVIERLESGESVDANEPPAAGTSGSRPD